MVESKMIAKVLNGRFRVVFLMIASNKYFKITKNWPVVL